MLKTVQKSPFLMRLVDPFQPTKEHAEAEFRFTGDARVWLVPIMIGIGALVVSLVGWAVDAHQFYFSYLVGWVFCLSLSLGALFFVLIQHLTKARWSVVVRRMAESLTWGFPLLAVLSIPIFFGLHDLYHWTHHDLVDPASAHFDPIIAGKHPYLNVPFFVVRLIVYFLLWSLVAYKLYGLSIREDVTGDQEIKLRQRKVSAWGLLVAAVTTAFASYDLVMSLDPHWFSTIFGVYFFAGAFWATHALLAVTGIALQRRGRLLKGVITKDHYQDLGKMLFGFTVFWTYIAFSQYMLIWYGNIPEETFWYRHRLDHGWEYHSAALLIAHFIIPFFVLLPRASKRALPLLAFMSVWALIMQWFDLHWLAMPVVRLEEAGFHWLDFTCWFGLFGLYLGAFLYRLSRHSLVPRKDAYLPASLHFQNT